MQKQQKRNKIIHKIISSTFSQSSKRRVNDIPWDFGFDLDRLAHGGITFAPVRKFLRNGKKTFTCLKKVLRNYALNRDLTYNETKDFEIQFQWRNKWLQHYITLPIKVGCEKLQILLVWGNQQFPKLSCVFLFTLENFSLVSLWQSNITISLTENHTKLACLLKTNGNT